MEKLTINQTEIINVYCKLVHPIRQRGADLKREESRENS